MVEKGTPTGRRERNALPKREGSYRELSDEKLKKGGEGASFKVLSK